MSEPGAPLVEKAADGIWLIRLPLPWPLAIVNVYLLRGDHGYVLIDTGLKTEDSLRALEKALGQLGLGWGAIREIVISHMHPDHVGAAAEIRRRSGAPVRMHPAEAALVAPRDGSEFFAKTESYLSENGVPEEHIATMKKGARAVANDMERFVPDLEITDRETLSYNGGSLEVLLTPGHSPALLTFYNADARILISTDALLERITPHIGVHPFYGGDPLSEYLESLGRLGRLEVERILPSHGDPFGGHAECIEAVQRHHARRLDKIHGVVDGNELHAYAVAGVVWGEDRSLIDRRFAMAEALSHLEHLRRSGRVERSQPDGVAYWSATS